MSGPDVPPRRPKLIVFLPLVLFLALAGVFLARIFGGDPSEIPSALIDRTVPKFALAPVPGIDRPGFSAADLAQGTEGAVTLVNVWASWCVPCREEHPQLMELATRGDVRLVGINYKDKPQNAADFLNGLGNPFAAVGSDESGRTGIDFGVYGVPETFVIDATGHIRYRYVGPLTPAGIAARLDPEIEKARTPRPAAAPTS
mgnify:CR=1 FL=1